MVERFFSQMIRALRESAKLSQGELAARCTPPRTQAAVAQWESGIQPLSERTLEVVAEALELSVRDMLAKGLRLTRPKRESEPPEAPAT